jgi:hypothetical protein
MLFERKSGTAGTLHRPWMSTRLYDVAMERFRLALVAWCACCVIHTLSLIGSLELLAGLVIVDTRSTVVSGDESCMAGLKTRK